jgi:hypothetical protein
MKYIISRFNHDLSWLKEYTDDYVLYDRSPSPLPGSIIVPNIGSDLYDKLTYIIDHYDDLPEVAVYAKANLFKYITKEEFDKVKNNTTFTPLLTANHHTYLPVCFYSEDGMYNEINDSWYLLIHAAPRAQQLRTLLGLNDKQYLKFAPGSNYILPKENILQHPKAFYETLREFLAYDVYPGEAQICERALYYLWKNKD